MSRFTKLQANSYVLSACIVAIFAVLIGCPMPDMMDPDPDPPMPNETVDIDPETTAPADLPADSIFLSGSNNVDITPSTSARLSFAFSEAVEPRSGSIILRRTPSAASGAQSTEDQMFNVTNASQVLFNDSGTIITLLSVNIQANSSYTLNIPEGVLQTVENENPLAAIEITFTTTDDTPVITNQTAVSYAQGSTITNIVFSSTAGTIASCSDGGTLPTGLIIDLSGGNCVVSGTIANSVTPQIYTVSITATNGTGSNSAQVEITVTLAPPVITNNPGVVSVAQGGTIASISFASTGGVIDSCTDGDTLPTGLSVVLDSGECIVSGTLSYSVTPSTPTATITATNGAGSDDATVDFSISLSAPIIPNHDSTVTVAQGETIAIISFFSTAGVIESCIATDLPDGLSIAEMNGECVVRGTVDYSVTPGDSTATITATNGAGSDSATIDFTISLSAPSIPNHDSTVTVAQGNAITDISFASTGGAIGTNMCTATGLPTGLSVAEVSGECVVSGTVGPSVTPSDYTATITATNAAGSNNASITFDVVAAASATLNAPSAPSPVTAGITTVLPDLIFMGSNLAASTCTITSTLPAGLVLTVAQNGQDCVVSGSVESSLGTSDYDVTVTAMNSANMPASATVTISVIAGATLTAPAAPAPFTAGTNPPNALTFTGSNVEAGSCRITSTDVTGLNLVLSEDSGNCEVTVTTTDALAEDTYTIEVTAENEAGTPVSATVELMVVAPATLTPPADPDPFTEGTINNFDIVFAGTNVAMCEITSAAVNGLNTSVSQVGDNCEVTVTTTTSIVGDFYTVTVTAENSAGTPVSDDVFIEVLAAATLSEPLDRATGQPAMPVFTAGLVATIPDIIFNGTIAADSCSITSTMVTGLNLMIAELNGTQGCILNGSIASTLPAGMYPVTVTANNSLGDPSADATITIEVLEAPTLTPPVAQSFTEGFNTGITDVPFELIFMGTNIDSCMVTSGSRTGLSINDATVNGDGNCVVTVTPRTALDADDGNYTLEVTAENSAGTTTDAMVTINVLPRAILNRPTSSATINVTAGAPITDIPLTGSNIASCSITNGIGLSAIEDGGNCVVRGSIGNTVTPGDYTVTVSAANSLGTPAPATRNIQFRVYAPTTLTPLTTITVTAGMAQNLVGTAGNIDIMGTNINSCSIPTTLPAGITMRSATIDRDIFCRIRLSVNALPPGDYDIEVTATNFVGTPVTATLRITAN